MMLPFGRVVSLIAVCGLIFMMILASMMTSEFGVMIALIVAATWVGLLVNCCAIGHEVMRGAGLAMVYLGLATWGTALLAAAVMYAAPEWGIQIPIERTDPLYLAWAGIGFALHAFSVWWLTIALWRAWSGERSRKSDRRVQALRRGTP
jgi:hypothetical protein